MKKIFILVITLSLLLLTACSFKDPHTVKYNNEDYYINPGEKTITYNDKIYKYEIDGCNYEITYPNKAVYSGSVSSNKSGMSISGSFKDNYYDTFSTYADGDKLIKVLSMEFHLSYSKTSLIEIAIIIVLIIWFGIFPKSIWFIFYGLWHKDAQPFQNTIYWIQAVDIILVGILIYCF